MLHRYFSAIDDLAKASIAADVEGNTAYYCISALSDNRRITDNIRATKLLAIDVDCGEGKPHTNWQAAAVVSGEFVEKVGLPPPMFVFSGRGLHLYWVLEHELTHAEWLPLANALKTAALSNKFLADTGLTTNGVLLLRATGTHNYKTGEQVKVLLNAEPTTPDILWACLSKYTTPVRTYSPPPSQAFKSPLLDNLSTSPDYKPANAPLIAQKCKQIAWAVKNQKEVDEPLWYSVLGVAAYCEDSAAVAVDWSREHPQFNESNTLQKLTQWQKTTTGPTTCAKFVIDRPTGCNGCVLKGRITSPAQIGSQHQEVPVSTTVLDDIAYSIPMPKGFKRTKSGMKATVAETDIDVCDFDIYPVSYGFDESLDYEVVRYHWNRLHVGWTTLVFRQALLVSGNREFPTAIADQGIVLPNATTTTLFQTMLRSYTEELRKVRTLTNLYQTMGWKQDNTCFVLGNTLIKREGSGEVREELVTLSNAVSQQGRKYYNAKGEPAAWVTLTNLLDLCDLPAHKFLLGVGFSAPLYNFTGLKGITISLYGPTGGGKTLAQYWMQSIYGDPQALHFSAKYTQNSLFARMGFYAHLPMSVDEVTMMNDDEVSDFCYWVTQGRDKIRLGRDAKEHDAKTWATPVVVSTNMALQSKLIASKADTDAQMARLLELSLPVQSFFTDSSDVGRAIYQAIHGCYGHSGKVFVKNLLEMGETAILEAIADATATFSKRFNVEFRGQERFWEQAIILADLASRLASKWGLIDYDHQAGTRWVLNQLNDARTTVTESSADSFDLLGEYMTEFASTILTVEHTSKGIHYNPYRLPKAEVRMRMTILRTRKEMLDRGTLMIDRRHFRWWLSKRGADYKLFRRATHSADVTPSSQKFSMGKGTIIRLAQVYVIGIDLRHPRMTGILEDAVDKLVDGGELVQLRT